MEEWKDIKGFEGIYQVSNKGRVRTFRTIEEARSVRDAYIKEINYY